MCVQRSFFFFQSRSNIIANVFPCPRKCVFAFCVLFFSSFGNLTFLRPYDNFSSFEITFSRCYLPSMVTNIFVYTRLLLILVENYIQWCEEFQLNHTRRHKFPKRRVTLFKYFLDILLFCFILLVFRHLGDFFQEFVLSVTIASIF